MSEFIGVFSTFLEVQTAMVVEFYGVTCYGRSSKDGVY